MSTSGSNLSKHSSDKQSYFSSYSFQEPNYQEQYLESVTFHLPAIIIQLEPITTLAPPHTPFTSMSGSAFVGNQGSINMVVPTLLMNRYEPL